MLTNSVYGSQHLIYFNDVRLNVGNAYNPNHGMFVAPYSGTYQFTVSVCSTPDHWIVLEFHVNSVVIDKIYAGDLYWEDCNSKNVFVALNANDEVFVRQESDGDTLMASSRYGFPSFGGTMLNVH